MVLPALFGDNGGTGHKGNLSLTALLEPQTSDRLQPRATWLNLQLCRMDRSSSSFLGSFWAVRHCLLRMYVRLEPRKSSAGSKWAIGCQLESLQPRESSFHPLRISRFQSSYSTLHYRTGHSAPTKAPRSSLLERSKAFAAGPSTAVSARATVLPQCPAPGWPVSTQ